MEAGPHPSQVYAWHVGARLFRNERELEVRGYPYVVSIVLVDPVVEGEGLDRRFISGKIKVSWRRQFRGDAAALERLAHATHQRSPLMASPLQALVRHRRLKHKPSI